jgi:L-ascorbate metabolism protein UlaG (beta-lactamase superfamily)
MHAYSLGLAAAVTVAAASSMAQVDIGGGVMITPVEHATMVIQAKAVTIDVDPVGDVQRFAAFPNPDIILITHIHRDHFDPAVIDALKTTNTVVVGPQNVIEELKFGQVLNNGETATVKGVQITAVPAYNTTPERAQFHPKGRDNGYVVDLGQERIYISGDTEDTPEMRALKDVDFAFVSMNLPYTMTVEQAASGVREMNPKAVSPYHYRGRGGMSDLTRFQQLVEKDTDIKVRLLDWYGKAEAGSED